MEPSTGNEDRSIEPSGGLGLELAEHPVLSGPRTDAVARASIPVRRLLVCLTMVLLLAGTVAMWSWWKIAQPLPRNRALLPEPAVIDGQLSLITPGYVLLNDLVSYDDELLAYLIFDALRHSPVLRNTKLLLHFDRRKTSKPYTLVLRGLTDHVASVGELSTARLLGARTRFDWRLVPQSRAAEIEQQTRLFDAAYSLPIKRKLEELPSGRLSAYVRRFIQFKSATDPRIRLRIEPIPKPLSTGDAQRLAADIITVAEFFSLPLEFLLGIGAMENNYLNIRGDLQHSIWKRRPADDDIVLERKRGRVRVLNDSAGVWQITRETLRYAHELVQHDDRNYTRLPEHLRPPAQLKMNEVSPHVLTTYAGVLLRDLLDRFDGDVNLAVSAYNGGPARPNLRYGAGVATVAAHARRVVEQAAALNGESVVRTKWLRAR